LPITAPGGDLACAWSIRQYRRARPDRSRRWRWCGLLRRRFRCPAHPSRCASRDARSESSHDQDNQHALSTGTLLTRDNAVDPASATIRLKATFPNTDERLWPGEFVNARLLLETRANVVAVPTTAVQRGPQGLFAWVLTADDTAAVRQIQVGPTAGDLTIITAGLNDGDRVVTDGQYKLQLNAPVTVSALPPTAAAAPRSAL
jgi:multidrug efflux system membrane fusion protein